MIRILNPPVLVPSGSSYYLVAPLVVEVDGLPIRVPEQFKTDRASVPRLVWLLIGPHELGAAAPIVHDWLYATRGNGQWTRRTVDRLFRQLMTVEGVIRWRRWLAWAAVRVGGWTAWPPQPGDLHDTLGRAAHAVWQVGLAMLLVQGHWWAAPPLAALLSVAKSVWVAWMRDRPSRGRITRV